MHTLYGNAWLIPIVVSVTGMVTVLPLNHISGFPETGQPSGSTKWVEAQPDHEMPDSTPVVKMEVLAHEENAFALVDVFLAQLLHCAPF